MKEENSIQIWVQTFNQCIGKCVIKRVENKLILGGKHTIQFFRHATYHTCIFNKVCVAACEFDCRLVMCDKFHSNTICCMGEKYREVVLPLPCKMGSKKPL